MATWRHGSITRLLPGIAVVAALVIAAGVGILALETSTSGNDDAPLAVIGAADLGACPSEAPLVDGASAPSFAYAALDGTIWVRSADGGKSQQVICNATGARNAAWSPTGRFVAHVSEDGSLSILNVETGQDTVVDDGTNGSASYGPEPPGSSMQWSPAGDLLVYKKFDASNRLPLGIWQVSLDTAPFVLVPTADILRFTWSPDGRRITYEIRGGTPEPPSVSKTNHLFLMNADGSGARKLTDGILIHPDPWSPDGRLLAYWKNDRGGSSTIGDIYIMDIETGREFTLGEFTSDEQPQWSSDRNQNVFYNLVIDPETQSAAPLFDRPSVILAWSPDGNKVAYVEGAAFGPPPRSLIVLDIVSEERKTLHTSNAYTAHAGGSGYYGQWSPDSRYYAFVAIESESDGISSALYVADTQSGEASRVLDKFDFGDVSASYSPDGNWLLIQQRYSQTPSIWMANADGSGLSKITDGVALRSGGAPWRPASD